MGRGLRNSRVLTHLNLNGKCIIMKKTIVPTPTRSRRVVHPFDTAPGWGGGAFVVDERPDSGPLNSHPKRAPAIT